jgi:hypothetical protein
MLFAQKRLVLILLALSSYSYNCDFGNKKDRAKKVFNNYVVSQSGDDKVLSLRNNLKDSINGWIDKGLYFVLFLNKANWVIDNVVFFNKTRDKALFLILIQPKDGKWPFDYAKVVAAEEVNHVWRFYYASYPLIEYKRENDQVASLDSIAAWGRDELIDDGFVDCKLSCKINYKYVESDMWFANWRREMHVRFLGNQLEPMPDERPGEKPY